ncbi:hypothetical protein FB451DRAFT_1358272 [Mycena latifolia]|nr:hypothetical protein FB451DRAFT_1358272 [Mycena latifolia]
MHRSMSYRKPVPPFIPSPPPSPSVSFRALSAGPQEEIPPWQQPLTALKLPEHWYDAIAQAQRTDSYNLFGSPRPGLTPQNGDGNQVLFEPLTKPVQNFDSAPELPQFASPVYFGTARVGKHQIYRPPTPPRGHKRPRLYEFQNISAVLRHLLAVGYERDSTDIKASLDRASKHVEQLPSRRSEGMYAWSIGTMDSYSRNASSISLPDTEWQLAQLSIDAKPGETDQPVWWGKIKALGAMIINRLKGVKEYGPALC